MNSFYLGSLTEPIYYTDNTFFYSNNEKAFRSITFREIDTNLYLDNNNQFLIDLNELPDIYVKDTKIKSIYDYLKD